MSLDLYATSVQLEKATLQLSQSWAEREKLLVDLVTALDSAGKDEFNQGEENTRDGIPYLQAECLEKPGIRHKPTALPTDYSVFAADGSHIDVERHLPIKCTLVNISVCQLDYGSIPNASLINRPTLAVNASERCLIDPGNPKKTIALEGPLLGIKRAVDELRALATRIKDSESNLTALGLVDGSLILWQLGGSGPPPGRYPPFVQQELLDNGLLSAMKEIEEVSSARNIALAGYISLPGSKEIINSLLNKNDRGNTTDELTDCDLFSKTLGVGERSALFASRVPVVQERYGVMNAIRFFYLNVGEEVARVEMPSWVTMNSTLMEITHTLILDQCQKGHGYPVALQEAHEQAVINGTDREEFRQMVEEMLVMRHLPTFTSQKQRSKIRRGV
jgi:hypothetical protein